MVKQRTLKNTIQATGVGLHSGEKVLLTLRPAPINTGIIFTRVDLPEAVTIPALAHHVTDTTLSTTLGMKDKGISTVEHLLAAIAGLGIDNLYIDVDSAEVPIMDGSSAPFVFLIQSAGIEEQNAAKKFIKIKKTVCIEEDDKFAKLDPYNGFKINFGIQYEHPLFKSVPTTASVDFKSTSFAKEISRARTYGFMSDYEKLQEMNLARGGSLENAVVVDEFRVVNEGGLRYQDEFVKHKILDAVGDLYLFGYSIIGEFSGFKSGHALNNALIRAVLEDEEAWEFVTFDSQDEKNPIWFGDFQTVAA
jgi:UDP-3-O-[3-hydroxymyristoyl] N-acetylglucosamine deacetylase